MRGYGLPRNDDVENPDCADILFYGLNIGKQNSKRKRRARRIWKKLARMLAKNLIKEDLKNEL